MEAFDKKRRKKRKTRRCLDEIRKKTNQTKDVCNTNKTNDFKVLKHKLNRIQNNYVTNNRLTLFTKAVRTETITRLQLCELKGKKLKTNKAQEIISHKCHNNTSFPINNNKPDIAVEPQNQGSDLQICSPNFNNDNINIDRENSESAVLFSSGRSTCQKSLVISNSSSTSDEDLEILDIRYVREKIENYVKQKYSQLLKTDLIEKEDAEFKKLLSKYCNNDNSNSTPDNQFKHQDVSDWSPYLSPEVPITESPRDYIKNSCVLGSVSNELQEPSPTESTSSSSIKIDISCTSPAKLVLYETPEYSFYPHRLN